MPVSEELYAELRRHFSEEQLIELAVSAALEPSRASPPRVRRGSNGLYRKGLQFKMRKITGLYEGVECETRRLLATLPQRDLEVVARLFETLDGARAGALHT